MTQKKPVLYLAVINTSFGEDVEKSLTEGFLVEAGFDVPCGESILPDDDRCNGTVIAEYDERYADLAENVEAVKNAIMKELE